MQRGRPRGASGRSAAGGGVILTCAGRAVGVGAAAGVDAETCPKEVEQEEWLDTCQRRECRRPEGLRLAQAESEGRWRAVGVSTGGERGAGAKAGAGQRAVRDCETRPSCQRGRGELARADEPAWVAVRHSEL